MLALLAAPSLALPVVLLALAAILSTAWGPGHHVEFAEKVWRRRRECLPRDVARLLTEERAAFYYGGLAADIINFKAYGGDYNHCHRWTIIEEIRALAVTPRCEAFAMGYLAHLAADTIAHNHFVPYHLARYARTKGLGHLYWEMTADRFVKDSRWRIVADLRADAKLDELDELINRTVPKKALSMKTNKLIFNHVLLVSHRERWRRGMARIHPVDSISLKPGFLQMFQRAALERIRLALRPRGFKRIQCVDPNGKDAQRQALRQRSKLMHRIAPGRLERKESERLAAAFLQGMESPPPCS